MKAVLWMKSSCTTCRNAKAKLVELGIELEVRDYFKKPLEAAELERLLPKDPTPMLGTKSPRYKELGLKDRRLSKEEAVMLMVMDNNLSAPGPQAATRKANMSSGVSAKPQASWIGVPPPR